MKHSGLFTLCRHVNTLITCHVHVEMSQNFDTFGYLFKCLMMHVPVHLQSKMECGTGANGFVMNEVSIHPAIILQLTYNAMLPTGLTLW